MTDKVSGYDLSTGEYYLREMTDQEVADHQTEVHSPAETQQAKAEEEE